MDLLSYRTDPRVYGKCRPAAFKDFGAYKHLPRSKPHVSGIKSTEQHTTKDSTSTSPKRSPPKTVQEIIQQTLNRRALGPKKLFKPFTSRAKTTIRATQISRYTTPHRQPKTKPQGKMNPKKKSKVDLSQIQFECDNSISLSSDTDLDHKSPSLTKPAAKRIDIKATPEHKSPEIRRSSRPKK